MSTLTVEIVAAPQAVFGVVAREFEPPLPGVAEAVADGWGAFVNGAYAVVLVLRRSCRSSFWRRSSPWPCSGYAAWSRRRQSAAPRARQPSGVSTQSARLPSGKANGARSPVWA